MIERTPEQRRTIVDNMYTGLGMMFFGADMIIKVVKAPLILEARVLEFVLNKYFNGGFNPDDRFQVALTQRKG